MEELLTLKDLSIGYKIKGGFLSAVKNVNLTIHPGEVLAIVGESGCGKSTIAHSIMQLLPKDSADITGEITFKGENISSLSEDEIMNIRGKHIGMIFQNPLDSLNPVVKCGDQVMEAIMLDGKSRQQARQEAIDLFSSVKMPDPEKQLDRFPHELSGGLRQRVMIAMMLSRNPELLIADEPTTALDVTIEAQIMDILVGLKNKYSTSIMLITHNFGIVAEVADRIAVMYAGQVVEQGTVFEIFDNPVHPYTRMLMQALPRKPKREGRLKTIEGAVPRLTDTDPKCRFSNRCPFSVKGLCDCQDPPEQNLDGTHSYNCHLQKGDLKWENL